MMYAQISNGQVITAKIISDPKGKYDANAESPTTPEGWQLVESEVAAEEVENGFPILSRKQLRFALLSLDITSKTVNDVIDSIADEVDQETARIFWEDSNLYHRDHPMVAQIGHALGISDDAIDKAWISAGEIES